MKSVKPRRWRKSADKPLGKVVAGKLQKRYGDRRFLKQSSLLKKAKIRTPVKSRYDSWDWISDD